jgi:hypothetical protein
MTVTQSEIESQENYESTQSHYFNNNRVRFIPKKERSKLSFNEKARIKHKVQSTFLKPMDKATAEFEDLKVQLKSQLMDIKNSCASEEVKTD